MPSTPALIVLTVSSLFLIASATQSVSYAHYDVPGRCPDVCHKEIDKAFQDCVQRRSAGCAVQFCGAHKVICALPDSVPDYVRPGETLVVHNASLSERITAHLDFSETADKTDVYILMDATSSMADVLIDVREKILGIFSELGKQTDVAVGFGIFRDERELTNGFHNMQSITTSVDAVRRSLRTLNGMGGFDLQEANLVGLYHAATDISVSWRATSRRIILLLSDHPGHEPTCGLDHVKITRESVVTLLNEKSISVVGISYNADGMNKETTVFGCAPYETPARSGQGVYISSQTGGVYLTPRKRVFDVDEVVRAIDRMSRRVSVLNHDCGNAVGISFEPKLPAVLTESTMVVSNIRVHHSICASKDAFECSINFDASGVKLQPLGLQFVNTSGCRSF